MSRALVADYEARAMITARDVAMKRARRTREQLLAVFHPSHTAYGDTPASQWDHLTSLHHATHTPTGDPR